MARYCCRSHSSCRFSGALALELTYGRKVEDEDDSTLKLADDAITLLNDGTSLEKAGILLTFPICVSSSEHVNWMLTFMQCGISRLGSLGLVLKTRHYVARS